MRKIRIPLEALGEGDKPSRDCVDFDDEAYRRAVSRAVREVIKNELSARQKQFIVLYYYEGMRMTEIAEETGVNVSTVSRTLARARKNVAKSTKYFLDFK